MENWVLVNNFGKSNTSDNVYYVMDYEDLSTLIEKKLVVFGDKAYVVKRGKMMFVGNNDKWYDMDGNEI